MNTPDPMERITLNARRVTWNNGPRLPHAPRPATDGKCGKCGRLPIELVHTAPRTGAKS